MVLFWGIVLLLPELTSRVCWYKLIRWKVDFLYPYHAIKSLFHSRVLQSFTFYGAPLLFCNCVVHDGVSSPAYSISLHAKFKFKKEVAMISIKRPLQSMHVKINHLFNRVDCCGYRVEIVFYCVFDE